MFPTKRKSLFVFVGIAFAIIIAIAIVKKTNCLESFQTHSQVPKTIWTYWDSPTLPDSVKLCLKSWKKYAPGYTIHMLNKSNIAEYISIPDKLLHHPNFNDSSARFSDLLRLHLLDKYGGIWMDASILMSEPLDNWLSLDASQTFFGYYSEMHTQNIPPIIESWFLVAKPNNSFIHAWKEEFNVMAEFPTVQEYVISRKTLGVNVKSLDAINYANYLAVYVACAKVFQIDKYPVDNLKLWKVEDGPYKYQSMYGWDPKKSMPALCTSKELRRPLVKLTKVERKELDDQLNGSLSNNACQWI